VRRPPPLTALLRHQATAGTALLAIAATALKWSGKDIGVLTMDIRAFYGEPWRLVTSALPHVGAFHLAFNVYWLWVFGTLVESVLGSWRTAAMFVFLAAGSAAAEYAVFDGGVGLSGIGYGLFAFLWVAGRRDARFAGAIDRRTVELFVAWFFLCVFLTLTKTLPVANVAHLAGALLGALLAATVVLRGNRRLAAVAATASLVLSIGLAATVFRPATNFSDHRGNDAAWNGYQALQGDENARAARLLTCAVLMDPNQADWWFNLGIARHRLQQLPDALAAYEQAAMLAPEDANFAAAVANLKHR
jgi:membrane associated rhomboid family serine protease